MERLIDSGLQDNFKLLFWHFEATLNEVQSSNAKLTDRGSEVDDLKQQLVDLRAQHYIEINEVKTNCQLELMEERRELYFKHKA